MAYGAGGDRKETEVIKSELLEYSFNVVLGSGRIWDESRQHPYSHGQLTCDTRHRMLIGTARLK